MVNVSFMCESYILNRRWICMAQGELFHVNVWTHCTWKGLWKWWWGGGVVFIWLHPKYHCPPPSSRHVTCWTEDNGGDSCPTWWFFLSLNTTKQIKRIQLSTTDRFRDKSSRAQRAADNSYSEVGVMGKKLFFVRGCFKETPVWCKTEKKIRFNIGMYRDHLIIVVIGFY